MRLLSNLETDRQKLLQIVLIGQPELQARCSTSTRLRQLRQRITVRYHLDAARRAKRPSSTSTTGCRSRAATAGRPSPAGRCRSIHRYSGGVPRLINAVCDTALLAGYVAGPDELSGSHVRRAIRELEGKPS